MKRGVLVCSLLLMLGCTSHSQFERAKEVLEFADYMKRENGKETMTSYYFIILQSNMCGACTVDVLDFLSQTFSGTHKPALIVLTVSRDDIYEKLGRLPEVTLAEDKNFKTEDYGLRMVKDLFFCIEDNRIEYWSYLTDEKYKQIAKHIRKH